jgi:hypothetical protein
MGVGLGGSVGLGKELGLGRGVVVGRGRVGLGGINDGVGGKGLDSTVSNGGGSALAGIALEPHPVRTTNKASGRAASK